MSSERNVYRETYELWSSEKSSPQPITIPQDWITALKHYAEELRVRVRLAVDREAFSTRLLTEELDILSRLVSDMMLKRMRKLIEAAVEGRRVENLLPVEAELYERLQRPLTSYREYLEHVKYSLDLSGESIEAPPSVVAVFVKPAPAIVDSEGVTRGPFMEGDIAALDPRTARLLEQGGYVRLLPATKAW